MKQISKNTKHTEKIAKAFLNKLKPTKMSATVVGLFGELGTGKTTFTQFIAKELKIKRKVNSPTFVIMKKYLLPLPRGSARRARGSKPLLNPPLVRGGNFKFLFHLDAYRLKNEKELLHLGWEEIISNPEHLIFIEWPENVLKAMPKNFKLISISHTKEGHRKFDF
ncbi:MAG: tRNA (adenosine(37)-N6)-threonylcarbamoyltransferase complex ATPase subunit type 1 TsaE [Candidatus Paceibacterota bacterium]|jgi:tRNA threonylcarbamoyladenosine biosynthesis protein TsaE